MNKDSRKLTQIERQMLVLSDTHLLQEVMQRTQMYFEPDAVHSAELEQLECLARCYLCRRIPLDIHQCYACETVICPQCQLKMQEENRLRQQLDPDTSPKGCPNCENNPELHLVRLKNAEAKKRL